MTESRGGHRILRAVCLTAPDRRPGILGGAAVDAGDGAGRPPVSLTVRIEDAEGWDLLAVGPAGKARVQVVRATTRAVGQQTLALPESGTWWIGLTCGGRELRLAPQLVDVPPDISELTIDAAVKRR